MSFLVVIQDEKTHIIDVQERTTHGAASQLAADIKPGQRARIVPKEFNVDVMEWFRSIKQRQNLGFDADHGVIPNGARSRGEGARGIGRMMYPAYGGMLEAREHIAQPPKIVINGSADAPPSLTLSSNHSETLQKKLAEIMEKLSNVDG
jgi:hypothetical protein